MVQKKTKLDLWSIRQENNESLRQYLTRFTAESNKVDRFDDGDAITAIIEGLCTGDFLKSVVGRVPSTMAELMNRAKTFMGVEDYLDGRRSGHQSSRRREEYGNEPSNPRKRVNKGGQATDSRPPTSRKPRLASNFRDYSGYTPLNAPVEQIYAVARDKFTAPTPMKGGAYYV